MFLPVPLSSPSLTSVLWLVLTACNPNACRASGRGLQPKGLRVKEVADFKVYSKGAGSGELKVTVRGPSKTPWLQNTFHTSAFTSLTVADVFILNPEGLEEPVKVLEMENGIYECNYYPIVTGKYQVTITWGGHSIPRRWDVQLVSFFSFLRYTVYVNISDNSYSSYYSFKLELHSECVCLSYEASCSLTEYLCYWATRCHLTTELWGTPEAPICVRVYRCKNTRLALKS